MDLYNRLKNVLRLRAKPCHVCLIIIFIACLLQNSIKPVTCLQCYTCTAEDNNENCIGTNTVRSCSRTQDRCLTQTIYSRERGKLKIDKQCASQAGCVEAEAQLDKKYFCDQSRDGWGCVECCTNDRCNESSGVQIGASAVMVLGIGTAVVLLLAYSR